MAGFWSWFLGVDDESSAENRSNIESSEQSSPIVDETKGTTIQDVVTFVSELKSYYYNDICKMQIDGDGSRFNQAMIMQNQLALAEIQEVLDKINFEEREYQDVWKKSLYSFYEEVEKAKLKTAQEKVYTILLMLLSINIKPELDRVILSRVKAYKNAWGIEGEIPVPKASKLVLTNIKDGVRNYRFGKFEKSVIDDENDKLLTRTTEEAVDNIQFEFEQEITTDEVWVYVADATRLQLNFMRRTCFVKGEWEYVEEQDRYKLFLDAVNVEDLEEYLKGVLKIVFSKKQHAIVTIVIPTAEMLKAVGPTNRDGNRIEICQKISVILKERNGIMVKTW